MGKTSISRAIRNPWRRFSGGGVCTPRGDPYGGTNLSQATGEYQIPHECPRGTVVPPPPGQLQLPTNYPCTPTGLPPASESQPLAGDTDPAASSATIPRGSGPPGSRLKCQHVHPRTGKLCNIGFFAKNHLESHQDVHRGIGVRCPYCTDEEQRYTFKTRATMRLHLKENHGNLEYRTRMSYLNRISTYQLRKECKGYPKRNDRYKQK